MRKRPSKPIREHAAVPFQVQGPNGLVTCRAFSAGKDREGNPRWTFYYVTKRGLLSVPVGPMLDAAKARLDEIIAEEQQQWADFAELQALVKTGIAWHAFDMRLLWLRTPRRKLPPMVNARSLAWYRLPRIGGRLWWVKRAKAPKPARPEARAA